MQRTGELGDVLVGEQLLASEQLQQAKRAADRLGTRLVSVLVEQELVQEEAMVQALRRALRMELFEPGSTPVESDAVHEVPYEEASRYRLLPLQVLHHGRQRVLRVAMADPLDTQAIEDIEFFTGSIIEPLIARPSQLTDAIRQHYRGVGPRVLARGSTPGGSKRSPGSKPDNGRPKRPPFGGTLDASRLTTRPMRRVQSKASAAQRVDALVAVLIRKGLLTREEYEDQLEALITAAAPAMAESPAGTDAPAVADEPVQ